MEVPKLPAVRYTHMLPGDVGGFTTVRTFITNDQEFADRVLARDVKTHGALLCRAMDDVLSAWGPER